MVCNPDGGGGVPLVSLLGNSFVGQSIQALGVVIIHEIFVCVVGEGSRENVRMQTNACCVLHNFIQRRVGTQDKFTKIGKVALQEHARVASELSQYVTTMPDEETVDERHLTSSVTNLPRNVGLNIYKHPV